ncbi:MAG TPA: hypothetical protein ENH80_11675 [Phycisphaerae bacterium]|nr:hypothetical protein [Phycisphaerae bacterium]HDZ44586.1 hypothetical protein [Phycisphaerae bacterium]
MSPLACRAGAGGLLLIAIVMTGCGGGSVPLWAAGADPMVEWIFECPSQLGHGMMGPGISQGDARRSVITPDGEVIVLTNYGTFWAWIEPCNTYLLDLESGKVLQRVKGPIGTIGTWYVHGKTVYVRDRVEGRSGWWAMDLATGKAKQGVRRPKGAAQPKTPRSAGIGGKEVQDPKTGKSVTWFYLKRGRSLIVKGASLELIWQDSDGQPRRRRLCRLAALTPYGDIIADDDHRLVVALGPYLISVDMQETAQPDGPGDLNAAATLSGGEPRRNYISRGQSGRRMSGYIGTGPTVFLRHAVFLGCRLALSASHAGFANRQSRRDEQRSAGVAAARRERSERPKGKAPENGP